MAPVGGGIDWEHRYRTAHTPWDKGHAHPALEILWREHPRHGRRILVPGCGSGHDVRVLACSAAEVVGLDVASGAVSLAESFPRVGNECYVVGDFLAAPYDHEFELLWEHTCFCAIPVDRRSDYVRAAARALRAGGELLAIFYLDPGHGHEEGPPFGCTLEELDDLFDPYFQTVATDFPIPTYPGREEREVLRTLVRRDL